MLSMRQTASGGWINFALYHSLTLILMLFGNHAKVTAVYLEEAGNWMLISYYNNSNAVICHHLHWTEVLLAKVWLWEGCWFNGIVWTMADHRDWSLTSSVKIKNNWPTFISYYLSSEMGVRRGRSEEQSSLTETNSSVFLLSVWVFFPLITKGKGDFTHLIIKHSSAGKPVTTAARTLAQQLIKNSLWFEVCNERQSWEASALCKLCVGHGMWRTACALLLISRCCLCHQNVKDVSVFS